MMEAKTTTVPVTLSPQTLEAVDRLAKMHNVSRDVFIGKSLEYIIEHFENNNTPLS